MSHTFYGIASISSDGENTNDAYGTTADAERSAQRLMNALVPVFGSREEAVAAIGPDQPENTRPLLMKVTVEAVELNN